VPRRPPSAPTPSAGAVCWVSRSRSRWRAFLNALSRADCSASIAGIEEAGATDYAVCLHMEV